MTTSQFTLGAEEALEAARVAARRHAECVVREMALEHLRPVRKHEAISRIMATGLNPTTNKQHSFTSAEALAETDEEYARHLAALRDAVAAKIEAAAEQRAAELLAEYAVFRERRAA